MYIIMTSHQHRSEQSDTRLLDVELVHSYSILQWLLSRCNV